LGEPNLCVPFNGGKTSTFIITDFALAGNRGKDSNCALHNAKDDG
jgi:hypothetical protein